MISHEPINPNPQHEVLFNETRIVPTDRAPLLTLEENRQQHGINAAVIAEISLPAQTDSGEAKLLHLVDFGEDFKVKAILWMPQKGELPHLGTARFRYGL